MISFIIGIGSVVIAYVIAPIVVIYALIKVLKHGITVNFKIKK